MWSGTWVRKKKPRARPGQALWFGQAPVAVEDPEPQLKPQFTIIITGNTPPSLMMLMRPTCTPLALSA